MSSLVKDLALILRANIGLVLFGKSFCKVFEDNGNFGETRVEVFFDRVHVYTTITTDADVSGFCKKFVAGSPVPITLQTFPAGGIERMDLIKNLLEAVRVDSMRYKEIINFAYSKMIWEDPCSTESESE